MHVRFDMHIPERRKKSADVAYFVGAMHMPLQENPYFPRAAKTSRKIFPRRNSNIFRRDGKILLMR